MQLIPPSPSRRRFVIISAVLVILLLGVGYIAYPEAWLAGYKIYYKPKVQTALDAANTNLRQPMTFVGIPNNHSEQYTSHPSCSYNTQPAVNQAFIECSASMYGEKYLFNDIDVQAYIDWIGNLNAQLLSQQWHAEESSAAPDFKDLSQNKQLVYQHKINGIDCKISIETSDVRDEQTDKGEWYRIFAHFDCNSVRNMPY